MKQQKEYHREANCQNCGMPLIDIYCAKCGQKANYHRDSFGHMVAHFAGDYFHYDGKFWITVKTMFTKPGQITLDYLNGKRVKFLNPIQLYFFVTTLFFLVLMQVNDTDDTNNNTPKGSISINIDNKTDSLQKPIQQTIFQIKNWATTATTVQAYDSAQQALPAIQRDGFCKHYYIKQSIKVNNMHDFDEKFGDKINHHLLKIFFFLLPFFALLLKFIFKQKPYLYVDYIIFSIHFHAFLFISLTAMTILLFFTKFNESFVNFIFIIGLSIYLYISLRTVFKQSAILTFFKQVFVSLIYCVALIISGLFLYIFSYLSV